MIFVRVICAVLILCGLLIIIVKDSLIKKNHNVPKKRDVKDVKICILIPARYEANVIEGLLKSIKMQSYKIDMKDVYIIIESMEDKTTEIAKKYDASIVLRKHLELKRKGYALDEGVKYIISKNKHYDMYFIFDADNILDKDFVKNMIPVYEKGYDLGTGYRNSKNGNDSLPAASSSLTFSLLNTIFNNRRVKETRNVALSGTGFYINGALIESWKGYPFHALTEDYELTLYSIWKDLTSFYNTNSVFYDEQPLTFKQTITQRIRWIRGFFDSRKKYIPLIKKDYKKDSCNYGSKIDEILGIYQYIMIIAGYLVWFFVAFGTFIYHLFVGHFMPYLIETVSLIIILYIGLSIFSLIIIIKEKDMIELNKKIKVKVVFYNPLFLSSYVYCALVALFKKEVKWDRIEHGKKTSEN